jgi:hypothetical protein
MYKVCKALPNERTDGEISMSFEEACKLFCLRKLVKRKHGNHWREREIRLEVVEDEPPAKVDLLRDGITDAAPGSQERIEALRKFYKHEDKAAALDFSPFEGDLGEQICDLLDSKHKPDKLRTKLLTR